VAKLDLILEKLAHAQRRLLRSADSVPADQWKTRPARGGWSAGELIAHLIVVERGVVVKADRIQQKTPKQFSFFQRLHVPIRLVEARVIRQKSPTPVGPELIQEKETMLAALRDARERTLAFLGETQGRNLSEYRWRHPFLGSFDMYDWFQFVAAHEARHEKQMREIAASLPKAIATLQK
jgi:DinB superfamily